MKTTSQLLIGGATFTFEVDDQDEMTAMVNSITLASPRRTCNVCGTDGLDTKTLIAYRTKEGYKYVKVRCECGAESTLGQYRDGDGFFWKEYEVYKADTTAGSGATGRQVSAPPRDGSEPVSPKALDAINGILNVIEWSPKEVSGWLEEHFDVTRLQDLTLAQSREAYKALDAEKKRLVPF